MFFNSYSFIFLFLPLVWACFKLTPKAYKARFLIVASLFFYGYFSWKYLLLLFVSIGFNYSIALLLQHTSYYKKVILTLSIALNLLPLAYFKYALTLDANLLFPLAISFYTFQQIAFLLDVYQQKVKPEGFEKYMFFVLFFPQLVAGPIVHYKEIISQIQADKLSQLSTLPLSNGILLFSVGLFKKVTLADTFLDMATHSFSHIAQLSTLDAWLGLLGYSLGIYFDFSAYSDMAIGLGLMFGIALPVNFLSPYKAASLVLFWRQWHITLSHFLKTYLYIPMGGNRHGKVREVFSLLTTMTLAGIWHGTGWTFLLWGFMHGVILIIVHLYSEVFKIGKMPTFIAVFVTFLTVTLLWVLFRATSLHDAMLYYDALFNLHYLGNIDVQSFAIVGAGLFIVWVLPNSMQLLDYPTLKVLNWKHALMGALFMFIALRIMADSPAKSFVYFNF